MMALLLFGKLGVVGDVVKMDADIVTRYHVVIVSLPWYPEREREGEREREKVVYDMVVIF